MRCPFCSNEDSQVKDSRPTEDNTAIRRRRICEQCGSRFTTFERIQLRDLVVVKSNDQKELYVKVLPKKLDEEVASLMVKGFGGTLTKLTDEQEEYISVSKEGPFKDDSYTY